jgi:carbonic anhydrase
MQRLINGIRQFYANVFLPHEERFSKMAQGQNPEALFITCSDSRVDPNLITQTGPGDLFILRNAGNIVPPCGKSGGGEQATIEYAIKGLGIRDIIVCGHSHCGAMQAMFRPQDSSNIRSLRSWLENAQPAMAALGKLNSEADDLLLLSEANVLAQLGNLTTYSFISEAIERGQLSLHGWIYRLDTGEVMSFDHLRGQFLPVGREEPARPVVA